MIIEICATSIESILNAQNAGAHRLELCENYSLGGVTPSEQFLNEAIKVSSLPIHVLIRPKGGDFIFNKLLFRHNKEFFFITIFVFIYNSL